MKRLIFIIISFLICTLLISCNKQKPDKYPDRTEFTISSNISALSIELGQELTISTMFENKSKFDYEIERGPELILVQYRKIDDPIGLIVQGPGYNDVLKSGQIYKSNEAIKIDEAGRYKINIAASFSIKIKQEYRNFMINAKSFEVEVKEPRK